MPFERLLSRLMQCNRIDGYAIGRKRHDRTINAKRIPRDIIVIGASAGGVPALQHIFSEFPRDMQAVVGVVLHRGPQPSELMSVLGRRSALPVVEPTQATAMKPGTIYLAPPDQYLLFQLGDITPGKWHQSNRGILEELVEGGLSREFDEDLMCRDGSVVPVRLKLFVVCAVDRTPIGLGAIIKRRATGIQDIP